jgi:hypothetical protein
MLFQLAAEIINPSKSYPGVYASIIRFGMEKLAVHKRSERIGA